MFSVNRYSGFELTARFRNQAGAVVMPSSVHWRVDDEATARKIQPWTEVVPQIAESESGELTDCVALIEIPGTINSILRKNTEEVKVVQIVADKGSPREYTETFSYLVRRVSRS